MSKKLNTYVHVHDADGNPHAFGPDDNVPADMAKLITNPKVWQSEESDKDDDDAAPRTGRRRANS